MIGKKYYEVHYHLNDENDEPVGRSKRVVFELWLFSSPGRIMQELNLMHGKGNFFVYSVVKL